MPAEPPVEAAAYLFVYGTLRRGLGSPLHALLEAHADFAGPATFQGRLYDVGSYPAAVPSGDGARVAGELYRLHPDAVPRLLAVLDRYEDYDPRDPAGSLYRREVHPVQPEGGEAVQAWIYLYNHDVRRLRPIPSGDYAAYRAR